MCNIPSLIINYFSVFNLCFLFVLAAMCYHLREVALFTLFSVICFFRCGSVNVFGSRLPCITFDDCSTYKSKFYKYLTTFISYSIYICKTVFVKLNQMFITLNQHFLPFCNFNCLFYFIFHIDALGFLIPQGTFQILRKLYQELRPMWKYCRQIVIVPSQDN